MKPLWKEIIPADQYVVSIDGPLNEGDLKVLTFLYQPLVGPVCISLYLTLRNQVNENRLQSEPASHYYIMNLLNLNLEMIYEARLKLEAIGLINTFVKKEKDKRSFVYIINPPLSPKQFFSDGLLNIFLYQKIGKYYYNRLKSFFSDEILPLEDYDKITMDFQQVFHSVNSYSFSPLDLPEKEEMRLPDKPEASPISISTESFDFDLLLAGLNESLVPAKAITGEVKDVIAKLSFLYGIDPIEMKNLVLSSVNGDNQIDIEKLRKEARDWYSINHYNSLPELVDSVQSAEYRSRTETPKTDEEKLIHYLETASPRELLEDLSPGSEPTQTDLRLIEDVMFKQKLNPGVTNVLIHYCMLRTDMKLSRSFVERIASHWARKKVQTVPAAIKLAKDEHKQYLNWQKEKGKSSKAKKPVRSEKLPDWFENRHQPKEQKLEVTNFEEQKRKMEERLKKYKKQ